MRLTQAGTGAGLAWKTKVPNRSQHFLWQPQGSLPKSLPGTDPVPRAIVLREPQSSGSPPGAYLDLTRSPPRPGEAHGLVVVGRWLPSNVMTFQARVVSRGAELQGQLDPRSIPHAERRRVGSTLHCHPLHRFPGRMRGEFATSWLLAPGRPRGAA